MSGVTVVYPVDFWSRCVAERSLAPPAGEGEPATGKKAAEPTHTARMLALAYYLDRRLADGSIRHFSHAAEIMGVSHTRASQILALLNLKPEIQEAILGCEMLVETRLRKVAGTARWDGQRIPAH